jgi:cobalamin biosynthesis Mg chelatase CobN
MKQFLILICIAVLCSCNAFKKISNKTQSNTDSTGAKSSFYVDVKKKDTTGTTITTTTNKKTSDSGYKKTTTIVREYYTDEFDFEGNNETKKPAKDSLQTKVIKVSPDDYFAPANHLAKHSTNAAAKQPGLRMKETITTEETGNKKTVEDAAMLQDQTAEIKTVDNSSHKFTQVSTIKSSQEKESSSKVSFSLLPWWLWLIIVIVLALFIYLKVINPFSIFSKKQ